MGLEEFRAMVKQGTLSTHEHRYEENVAKGERLRKNNEMDRMERTTGYLEGVKEGAGVREKETTIQRYGTSRPKVQVCIKRVDPGPPPLKTGRQK